MQTSLTNGESSADPTRRHNCDWCQDDALFYFEVGKIKQKHGWIGTGKKWWSCSQHLRQLGNMAEGNKSVVCSIATGLPINEKGK